MPENPYLDGQAAQQDGFARAECPYSLHTMEAWAWLEGWDQAMSSTLPLSPEGVPA